MNLQRCVGRLLALGCAGLAACASAPSPRPAATASCLDAGGYPARAARAGATGTTVVRVEVAASGVLERATVVRSAGDTPAHKALDAETMRRLGCPGLFKPAPEPYTRELEHVWSLK